jgi:hypothetical protein
LNSLILSIPFFLFSLTQNTLPKTGYQSLVFYYLAMEYFHFNWSASWPWLTLGKGLARGTEFIQWYEFTGEMGGTLLILLANILITKVIISKVYKNIWHVLVLLVLTIGLSYAISFSHFNLEKGSGIHCVVVQPNIDPYEELHSDAKKWLEAGWIDYLAPQLYWQIKAPQQSYPVLLKWWSENNPKKRHIYPGVALYKIETQGWPITELIQQIAITRSLAPKLALGNIFFRVKFFNNSDVFNAFSSSTYGEPALAPVMSWKKSQPSVMTPTILGVKDGNLTWKAAKNSKIRSWTLYQQVGNRWQLIKILNAGTTEIELEPGTYALCAVDRMLNESIGVKIFVN